MSKTNKAVKDLLKLDVRSAKDLTAAKRKIARKHGIGILQNSDILKELANIKASDTSLENLRRILRKRAIRTLSGIAPVAVLTKPYSCPGKCSYCPTEPDVPQSYLSNEPAVMRAIRCNYDPYVQMQDRLRALEANGHEPTKIELIVIGGTWSALPIVYQYQYITECFRGANEYGIKTFRPKAGPHRAEKRQNIPAQGWSASGGKTNLVKKLRAGLSKEQKKNERAKYRIIGITLETRPDHIDEKELWRMREMGCTRVEIGVQTIDNDILKLNRRGHDAEKTVRATKLLKDYGFKVTYHIMPGLPGSTPGRDFRMFKQLFDDERFQPDQIKFYPTVVTKGSLLYRWWKSGKYKPYPDKTLRSLIAKCKSVVPSYVRIIRLIRDIPGESIIAGNRVTNLRQIMRGDGVVCRCIRCREVGARKFEIRNLKLQTIEYEASGGEEFFMQYTDKSGKILYGFCRLRLISRNPEHPTYTIFHKTAVIRELHVYGELVSVGKSQKVQHAGLGKKLLAAAEKIARDHGYEKMAVISGVGARNYYRKLGYRLRDTYVVKNLRNPVSLFDEWGKIRYE